MNSISRIAILGTAALLSACATTPRPAPVDVTRYHLGVPVQPGNVVVEPMATDKSVTPEYQVYANAVGAELARLGYTPQGPGNSPYIALVGFSRESRGLVRKQAPLTIGIGAGSYSGGYRGGVGVGGGASIPIGGSTVEVYATELRVQLRRRGDNTVVWEGRAQTQDAAGEPAATAQRLAQALFRDFPGESGITITVK